MPSNWLYADTNFPTFAEGESVEKKIDSIQNYLFMLVEQMRYQFHNLDDTNFNKFKGSVIFEKDLGSDGTTVISGDRIKTGQISADVIRLYNAMTVYADKTGNASGGHIGYYNGMTTIDSASQTTDGAGVAYAVRRETKDENGPIVLPYRGHVIATQYGARLGYSEDPHTENLSSVFVSGEKAEIRTKDTQVICNDGKIELFPNRAAKGYGLVVTAGYTRPPADTSGDIYNNLGGPGFRWTNIYAASGIINTSDKNRKKDISYELNKYEGLYDRLMPTSFEYVDGTSGRTHIGFISQDVEDALNEEGLTAKDFAAFCKDEVDGKDVYALRYEEFIALNTWQIQKMKRHINKLEQRIAELEHRITKEEA